MSKMCITVAAQQFDPAPAEGVVGPLHDVGFFEFRVKTGPAATCIELAAGIEQGLPAAHAMIVSTFPALLVLTAVGRFGACLPGYTVLFRIQLFFPFLVGLANFCHAGIVRE